MLGCFKYELESGSRDSKFISEMQKMNDVLSTEELKIFCDAFFLFDEDKR